MSDVVQVDYPPQSGFGMRLDELRHVAIFPVKEGSYVVEFHNESIRTRFRVSAEALDAVSAIWAHVKDGAENPKAEWHWLVTYIAEAAKVQA
jgi:hypothetical protein